MDRVTRTQELIAGIERLERQIQDTLEHLQQFRERAGQVQSPKPAQPSASAEDKSKLDSEEDAA